MKCIPSARLRQRVIIFCDDVARNATATIGADRLVVENLPDVTWRSN